MAEHRTRVIGIGIAAVLVAVMATAFALGGSPRSGSSGSGTSSSGSGSVSRPSLGRASSALAPSRTAPRSHVGAASHGTVAGSAGVGATGNAAPVPSATAAMAGSAESSVPLAEQVSDGVTATRVVKTGSLSLRVARGKVQSTINALIALTTRLRGYVSTSHTDNVDGSPNGEVTLRIPAASFDDAVNSAEGYGRVTSLTTNAHDVTGRYVDLAARESALKRTRSTYLTILGRATTIGATLAVQQRVDDVQQQIEELQGQLKVLGNQSADGTLTVDVSQLGSTIHPTPHHHKQTGIGAAWHRSINRFSRGFDAIVGALGPLLLVLLVIGVIGTVAAVGYRGVRRATS